jgi:Ala-tRNA(Pro) deacylase
VAIDQHVIGKAHDLMMTRAGSRKQELIEFLESIGINVNRVPYPAHSTVEEGRSLRGDMPGTFTKNLLLKDKKGRLFLVAAEEARSVDLRTLHTKVGANGRLGFAPSDIVREVLGVEPGAITPLALMQDGNHTTTVVLDAKIMNDIQLNFHPLVNTESIGLSSTQLMRFIAATGHQYIVVELET